MNHTPIPNLTVVHSPSASHSSVSTVDTARTLTPYDHGPQVRCTPDQARRLVARRFRVGGTSPYPWICRRGGRQRLAEIVGELDYREGVEIGTRSGTYSKVLCESAPKLHLTCVDPWVAYNRLNQEQQNAYYQEAVHTLGPLNVDIRREFSVDAVLRFADGTLDFVFVDGSHDFDDAAMDIICWSRKVRSGGIVAVHDYSMFPDVHRAVDAYTISHRIEPWYLIREYEGTAFWVQS